LLSALLAGCVTYQYNGSSYHSSEEALAAQKQHEDEILAKITRLPSSINGTALVIVPSKATVAALGVTRKGNPDPALIDYVASTLFNDYSYFSKYLEASRAFSSVEARTVDHPVGEARNAAGKYAAVIYLQMSSPEQVGWMLLKPGVDAPIAINFDSLAQPGAPKIDSWIKFVADAVRGEHR
jgi:hypothetical protein